jgi:hypothetical protein
MSSQDFIPAKDADLDAWAANFDTKITATPTAYGLVAGDATAFHALALAYTAALAASTNPATRTSVTVEAKTTSRTALVFKARALARIVQADPDTTNAQRAELGLTVPATGTTPAVAPPTKPVISIDTGASLQTGIRIVDELTPSSRAKPARVAGCDLYGYIGTVAPTSADQYRYLGEATRNQHVLTHPDGSGGKTLWLKGQWVSSRGQLGAFSNVVTATIAA